MTSAYPTPMDKLTAQVRDLATELGQQPSLNQIMKHCRVGRPKAAAALANLTGTAGASQTPDAAPATVPDEVPTRRLHAVPAITPDSRSETASDTTAETVEDLPAPVVPDEVTTVVDAPVFAPVVESAAGEGRERSTQGRVRSWPLLVIALGAFVAIWGGWVELGKLTGFGEITPLPGIADDWTLNSAITLPLGMEAYAAFALNVWLSNRTRSAKARRFAKWSALGALVLGAAGQVAYHLMKAAGLTVAPWQITAAVSCLPVIVLGFGAALVHLMHNDDEEVRS